MAKKSKRNRYAEGGLIDYTQYAGLGNLAGNLVQSTNSPIGNIGGGLLSGAASGAALGLPGMIVGGILGAGSGIIKNKQQQEAEARQKEYETGIKNTADANAFIAANRLYAEGGTLNQDTNITEYNGLTHQQGGIPIGQDAEVEDGETRGTGYTEDYVFSNKLKPNPKSKKTYADESKAIQKKYEGYDTDRYANKAKQMELTKLMMDQEATKRTKFENDLKKLQFLYPEQFAQMQQAQVQNQVQNQVPSQPMQQEQQMDPMMQQQMMQQQMGNPEQMKYGGKFQYPDGGPIKPSTKVRAANVSQMDDKEKQAHMNMLKYLKQTYPDLDMNQYSQYALYDERNNDYFKSIAPLGDSQFADPNLKWDKQTNREVGYLYPSYYSDPNLARETERMKYPITEQQFAANPEVYKGVMTPENYGVLHRYITGENPKIDVKGKTMPMTHDAMLEYTQQEINKQPPPKINELDVKILASGGNLGDPPTRKRYLRSHYNAEIERRKAAGITDFSDMAIMKGSEFGRYQPDIPEGMTMPTAFDPSSEFENDFADKYFHPDSKQISLYKSLIDQGKEEEAKKLVLGYYDRTQKGGGTYNPSTFKDFVEKGSVIPITYENVGNLEYFGTPSKEIQGLYEGINYTPKQQKAYGGRIKFGGEDPYPSFLNQALNNAYPTQEIRPINLPSIGETYFNQSTKGMIPFDPRAQILDAPQERDLSKEFTPTNQYRTLEDLPKPKNEINVGLYSHDKNNPIWNVSKDLTPIGNESVQFPTYSGNTIPKGWNETLNVEKFNAGQRYTPQNETEYMNKLGIDPEFSQKFMSDPKLVQDYYSWIGNMSPDEQAAITEMMKKKDPKFDMKQALGQRYGAHHNLLLDPYLLQRYQNFKSGPPQVLEGYKYGPPTNIEKDNSNPPIITENKNVGGPPENTYGENPLKPFGPDYLGAGLSMLPNVIEGIGNFSLANKLKFDRVAAERMNPDYVDPTRAIQETRNQYAGVKDTIRQNSGGTGNLMSNLIGATASQSQQEAGIQSQYDNANAGIYNESEQFNTSNRQNANLANAEAQKQEMLMKTQLKQQGYQNVSDALNTGLNTYFQSKQNANMMNVAGGENFYYKRIGGLNQTPVKVFQGNGYHWYEDPTTGERKFLDPNSGKQIKDANSIAKFSKDIESSKVPTNNAIMDILNKLPESERAQALQWMRSKNIS